MRLRGIAGVGERRAVEAGARHVPELDGLRGLAALIVIVSHFSIVTEMFGGLLGFGGGQLGVMLFFSLSGFLMGWLYLTTEPNRQSVAIFYLRRMARVAPLYLLVVLVSFVCTATLGTDSVLYKIRADALPAHLLFWHGDSILWTIPVEVQFYAVFPILWWVFSRIGYQMLIWLALGLAAIVLGGYPAQPALLPYAAFFASGLAISLIGGQWKLDGALIASFLFVILLFPRIRSSLGFGPIELTDMWRSPAYLVAVGALLFSTLHSRIASQLLGSRVFGYLGKVSYSIYLLHLPVLLWLSHIKLLAQNLLIFFPIFVLVTLLIASASYWLIEAPSRRAINSFGGWRLRQVDSAANHNRTLVAAEVLKPE